MAHMFLDSINTNLFRPLVSKNVRKYGVGLWAIYEALLNQYIEGECTPKEARQVIQRALAYGDQVISPEDWISEEGEAEEVVDHVSMAAQIYAYLRSCGWVTEMDDVGYRRIVYMPQDSSRLLQAINSVSEKRRFDMGSTLQGVYGLLQSVENDPVESGTLVGFAASNARALHDELKAVAASAREVTHKMRDQKIGANLFQTFFDEFLTECLGSFNHIKIHSHPNRYRSETLSIVVRLLRDSEKLEQIARRSAKEKNHTDYDAQLVVVRRDLEDIFRAFDEIPQLMELIDRYRSITTRRTREAMQYSFDAVPEIGRKISGAIKVLSDQCDDNVLLPVPAVHEEYVSANRLSKPRARRQEPEPTRRLKKTPNNWDVAFSMVYDEYLERRAEQPDRLEAFIERELSDKAFVTTCDMTINGLDDFLAFIQLMELLHNAVPANSPFSALSKQYKVTPVPGVITDNEFISAPAIRVERFGDQEEVGNA